MVLAFLAVAPATHLGRALYGEIQSGLDEARSFVECAAGERGVQMTDVLEQSHSCKNNSNRTFLSTNDDGFDLRSICDEASTLTPGLISASVLQSSGLSYPFSLLTSMMWGATPTAPTTAPTTNPSTEEVARPIAALPGAIISSQLLVTEAEATTVKSMRRRLIEVSDWTGLRGACASAPLSPATTTIELSTSFAMGSYTGQCDFSGKTVVLRCNHNILDANHGGRLFYGTRHGTCSLELHNCTLRRAAVSGNLDVSMNVAQSTLLTINFE